MHKNTHTNFSLSQMIICTIFFPLHYFCSLMRGKYRDNRNEIKSIDMRGMKKKKEIWNQWQRTRFNIFLNVYTEEGYVNSTLVNSTLNTELHVNIYLVVKWVSTSVAKKLFKLACFSTRIFVSDVLKVLRRNISKLF